MEDILHPITGNKMLSLKEEIYDLRKLLQKADDPGKIQTIKRLIAEKETYYNILADRSRMRG